jgi:hypothetical protein
MENMLDTLKKINEWWETKEIPKELAPETKRQVFTEVVELFDDRGVEDPPHKLPDLWLVIRGREDGPESAPHLGHPGAILWHIRNFEVLESVLDPARRFAQRKDPFSHGDFSPCPRQDSDFELSVAFNCFPFKTNQIWRSTGAILESPLPCLDENCGDLPGDFPEVFPNGGLVVQPSIGRLFDEGEGGYRPGSGQIDDFAHGPGLGRVKR